MIVLSSIPIQNQTVIFMNQLPFSFIIMNDLFIALFIGGAIYIFSRLYRFGRIYIYGFGFFLALGLIALYDSLYPVLFLGVYNGTAVYGYFFRENYMSLLGMVSIFMSFILMVYWFFRYNYPV